MPAVAVVNSSNSSFTITDAVGGATTKNTYPLAGVSSYYSQSALGEKVLYLMYQGLTVIAAANTVGNFGYGNSIFGSTDPDVALTAAQVVLGSSGSSGSTVPMFKFGDVKHSYFPTDHDGWVKLDGRLKNSLPAAQQANATALGFGASLVNAADLTVVGASGTKAIGSTGGSAVATITQSNLPALNLLGGSHNHTAADSGHNHATWAGSGGQQLTDNNGTGSAGGFSANLTSGSLPKMNTGAAAAQISVAASGNLTIPLGGSGTALPTQNPYLAANTFIYLGV
jgi:hypothetical protein